MVPAPRVDEAMVFDVGLQIPCVELVARGASTLSGGVSATDAQLPRETHCLRVGHVIRGDERGGAPVSISARQAVLAEEEEEHRRVAKL